MSTNIYNTLKQFGLSKKEVEIYLICLRLKDQITPHTISKETKIARTTIYDILMNLSLKGLVEIEQSDGFSKQQTLVKAKNPSVLREILQKKRQELVHVESDIINILPELKKDFHKNESNSDFQYYPGIEGAKKILFDDTLDEMKLEQIGWDRLLPMDIFGSNLMDNFVQKFLEKRNESKSATRVIVPLNDWTKHVITYQSAQNPEYLAIQEYRYIENPIFDIYIRLRINGNYINIVSAHEDEIWGMKIKSKALSQTFKLIFETSWPTAKPITKELTQMWGENEFINKEQ